MVPVDLWSVNAPFRDPSGTGRSPSVMTRSEVVLSPDHRSFRERAGACASGRNRNRGIVAELVLPPLVFDAHLERPLGASRKGVHVEHDLPVEVGFRLGRAAELVIAF